MLSENLLLTPFGMIKKVTASKLAKWYQQLGKNVPDKVVKHSFKKCYITTLDGTEDYTVCKNLEIDYPESKCDSKESDSDCKKV